MKNGTKGSIQLVILNKTKSPHQTILIDELARRPKVHG